MALQSFRQVFRIVLGGHTSMKKEPTSSARLVVTAQDTSVGPTRLVMRTIVRWANIPLTSLAHQDYSPDDLKGRSEPTFSLDRALKAHTLTDGGIELRDHRKISQDYKRASQDGTLDKRDPVVIAGGEAEYAALYSGGHNRTSSSDVKRTGSLRAAGESLKKRIGSLRKKKEHEA
jgi:hypothetical protein